MGILLIPRYGEPIQYKTVEDFYRARFKQEEDYMDPSMQPERRLCQCKSQKKLFSDMENKIAEFEESDMVNHPAHYNSRKLEVIDIIEMCIEPEKNSKVAYMMSNVLKYILRFRAKNGLEDLKKAQWYLNRMIEKVEEETEE